MLGITISNPLDKYLGLPTLIGRNKKAIFAYTKEKKYGGEFMVRV